MDITIPIILVVTLLMETYSDILMVNGFDKIVDEKDFPSSLPRGKLGIHDEYAFPYFLSELNKQKQPFFSNIFTVSTHSPYDMKMQEVHKWPEFEKRLCECSLLFR